MSGREDRDRMRSIQNQIAELQRRLRLLKECCGLLKEEGPMTLKQLQKRNDRDRKRQERIREINAKSTNQCRKIRSDMGS
jgi:hypothetical protein